MIGDISRGKYARHTGSGRVPVKTRLYGNVAVFHIQLLFEQLRVRGVSDRNKQAVDRQVTAFRRVLGSAESNAGDATVISEHIFDDMFPGYSYIAAFSFSVQDPPATPQQYTLPVPISIQWLFPGYSRAVN